MKYFVLSLCALLCVATVLGADEVTYDCTKDTEVDEDIPMLNFGEDEVIEVYADWEDLPTLIAKCLFCFPIDIEPITQLNQAVLRLHVVGNSLDPGPIAIFRAGDPWDEMTVVWDNRPAEDRSITIEDNAPPVELVPVLWEIDVTDIVAAWIDGDPNHGFYLDVPDNNNWVGVDLATRDNPVAEIQPKLWLDYIENDISEEPGSEINFEVSAVSSHYLSVSYNLPVTSDATLSIFDASGALVTSIKPEAGTHSLTLDASPGVYFVRLETGNQVVTRKAVVID